MARFRLDELDGEKGGVFIAALDGTETIRDLSPMFGELVRVVPDKAPEQSPDSDLRAAKERLGAWLAREYGRVAFCCPTGDGWWSCELLLIDGRDYMVASPDPEAQASGPTEAAAILAALEKAQA